MKPFGELPSRCGRSFLVFVFAVWEFGGLVFVDFWLRWRTTGALRLRKVLQ